jgi:hypothetical protein
MNGNRHSAHTRCVGRSSETPCTIGAIVTPGARALTSGKKGAPTEKEVRLVIADHAKVECILGMNGTASARTDSLIAASQRSNDCPNGQPVLGDFLYRVRSTLYLGVNEWPRGRRHPKA